MTSLLRQNDVIWRNYVKVTSFWRYDDVIITSHVQREVAKSKTFQDLPCNRFLQRRIEYTRICWFPYKCDVKGCFQLEFVKARKCSSCERRMEKGDDKISNEKEYNGCYGYLFLEDFNGMLEMEEKCLCRTRVILKVDLNEGSSKQGKERRAWVLSNFVTTRDLLVGGGCHASMQGVGISCKVGLMQGFFLQSSLSLTRLNSLAPGRFESNFR